MSKTELPPLTLLAVGRLSGTTDVLAPTIPHVHHPLELVPGAEPRLLVVFSSCSGGKAEGRGGGGVSLMYAAELIRNAARLFNGWAERVKMKIEMKRQNCVVFLHKCHGFGSGVCLRFYKQRCFLCCAERVL